MATGMALGILAGLLLSACGGGDDSIADPPISSAPTSSATQSPQRESPEHFIRRWADVDIAMQKSGETGEFRSMSQKCHGCAALAERVESIYDDGGFIRTKGWKVKTVRVVSSDQGHRLVDLRVVAYPTTYRERAHGPEKHLPGGPATYQLGVKKVDGTWKVDSLGRLAS